MGMLEKQKENMGEVNKSKALTFWLEESKRFSKLQHITPTLNDTIMKEMEYFWAHDVMYIFKSGDYEIDIAPRSVKK